MKPVTLCHDYPYAPVRVWQLATDYGALAQVMEGVVSFKGLPDGRVYTGQNISVMVSLFGKLPAQPYSMEVLDCDDTNMVLRSSEKGAGVKSWRHTLRVVETEIECQLIDRIEIARQGEVEPFQTIGPIDSRALPDMETNGFEMLDMNFDGHLDMRIIEFLPAGPNIPYLHWLWSPESGRFVSAGFLNELGYTEFDEEERLVFAPWRSSAAEMGEDTYVYEAGELKQTGRIMRRYTDDGACTQTSYEAVDGQLIKTASGPCPEE